MSIVFRSFVLHQRIFVRLYSLVAAFFRFFVRYHSNSLPEAASRCTVWNKWKDFRKNTAESWHFLSDVIYFNRQELGKFSISARSAPSCSLSKARYFDRSHTGQIRTVQYRLPGANAYGQPVECRFSKSAATSVAFLLIAPDIVPGRTFYELVTL